MDSNFYSKKYMIIIGAMCILLLLLTIKAFDYLPKPIEDPSIVMPQVYEQGMTTQGNEQNMSENTRQTNEEEEEDDDDDDESDDDENNTTYNNPHQKHGHIDYMPTPSNSIDFDEIPAPKGTVEEEIYATN